MTADYRLATNLGDLKQGGITSVEVNGRFLAFYLVDGQPYCTEDSCTHEGMPISNGGYVDGDEVECAWHGARFNVRTGGPARYPASYPLRTFPVQVRDGQVYVAID